MAATANEELAPLAERTIVTGVAGDDIHVMGIRLVEHALKSAGAKVVSLASILGQEVSLRFQRGGKRNRSSRLLSQGIGVGVSAKPAAVRTGW
jgi:hypothetical protein